MFIVAATAALAASGGDIAGRLTDPVPRDHLRLAQPSTPALQSALTMPSSLAQPHSAHAQSVPALAPSEFGRYRLTRVYQSTVTAPLGVIENPSGLHVATDGSVFVADAKLHRVQRFTGDGVPLAEYGRPGNDPGQLYKPSGIAADVAHDRVFIADTGNDRLSVHTLDGTFVENLGPYESPEALALGPDRQLYLFAARSGRIHIVQPNGTEIANFAIGAFVFHEAGVASGLAVDGAGDIYIAMNLGVRVYGADGNLKNAVRFGGGAPVTRDVTFDAAGRMYVLEEGRLWHSTGPRDFGTTAIGRGVRAIAAGAKGTLYLIYPATRDIPAGVVMRRFEGGRQVEVRRWGIPETVLGWLNQPTRLSIGADGDLYVVDELRRVQRFSPRLDQALGQWLVPGLQDVTATRDRDLVVSRTRYGSSDQDPDDVDAPQPGMVNVRLERYALGGPLAPESLRASPAARWTVSRESAIDDPATERIVGMAMDARTEQTSLLDSAGPGLRGVTSDGQPAAAIHLPDPNAGLPGYADVALAPDGTRYVLHIATRRALHFDAAGHLDRTIDLPEWAWRIEVDPHGHLIVPTARRWVWRLDPDGRVDAVWPLPPPATGSPDPPSDVAVDAAGDVFILDQAAAAIYVFSPDAGARMSARPPAGSLACQLAVTADAAPRTAGIGHTVAIAMRVDGSCASHRRTGERPAVLVRTATLTVTLPSGVTFVPGSAHPPADIVDGRFITWRLQDVPPAGVDISFAVVAARPGRHAVPSIGRLDYLDGWFNFGSAPVPPAPIDVPTPTATRTPPPTSTPSSTAMPSPTETSSPTAPPWPVGQRVFLPLAAIDAP